MRIFSDDEEPTLEDYLRGREEFMDVAEDKQIAEGDISVSETIDGKNPLPELDDREIDDDILGEDDLTVLDEEDPELALSEDEDDDYLDTPAD